MWPFNLQSWCDLNRFRTADSLLYACMGLDEEEGKLFTWCLCCYVTHSMFENLARAEKCRGRAYISGVICIKSDSLSTLSQVTSKLDLQYQHILCVMSWNKRSCFSGSLVAAGFGVMGIGDALAWEGPSSPHFSVEPWVPITSCASRLRTVLGGGDAALPNWIMRQVRGFKQLIWDTLILNTKQCRWWLKCCIAVVH